MKKSHVRLLATIALATISACRFSFDRQLAPGEISGAVIFEGSPGMPAIPAAGARVAVENSSISVVADSRGSFVIHGLPQQTYTMDFTAMSFNSRVVDLGLRKANITLSETNGTSARYLGQLVIAALGGISGTVTNNGVPVNGASVAITSIGRALTVQGAFSFTNLLPGDYTLTVVEATPQGALVSDPVSLTVSPRQISHVPAVDLAKATLFVSGGAAGSALVQGSGPATISIGLETLPNISQTANTSGAYQLADVPAGVFNLVASAPGYRSATASNVILAGPPTAIPLLILSPLSMTQAPDAGPPPSVSSSTTSAQSVPMAADGGLVIPATENQSGITQGSSSSYQAATATGAPTAVLGSQHFRFTPTGASLVATDAGSP